MYARSELAVLAGAFLTWAPHIKTAKLSRALVGDYRFVDNLLAGRDCKASAVERASAWFDANWPLVLDWPANVPRRRAADPLRQRRRAAAQPLAGGAGPE
jgi:hypothetical protein